LVVVEARCVYCGDAGVDFGLVWFWVLWCCWFNYLNK